MVQKVQLTQALMNMNENILSKTIGRIVAQSHGLQANQPLAALFGVIVPIPPKQLTQSLYNLYSKYLERNKKKMFFENLSYLDHI